MKDKYIITKEKAKKIILLKNNMAHTFYNLSFALVGGNHDKKSLFHDIDSSYMCKKSGKQAIAMGHGLVIIPSEKCKQSDLLFVETIPEFNNKQLKQIEKELK
ncbi:MAG: hypothetical protein AABY22_09815 [Nanoarchaeota archaeon]